MSRLACLRSDGWQVDGNAEADPDRLVRRRAMITQGCGQEIRGIDPAGAAEDVLGVLLQAEVLLFTGDGIERLGCQPLVIGVFAPVVAAPLPDVAGLVQSAKRTTPIGIDARRCRTTPVGIKQASFGVGSSWPQG
jgi:hypothetical protein